MAVLQLSYGSFTYHQVVNVEYDDVAHVVNGGSLSNPPIIIPSGLGPGATFFWQDAGTDHWELRVQDAAPYAYVYYYSTAIAQDLVITDVDVVAAMNGANGSVTGTGAGTGTKRWTLTPFAGPQASNVFANVPPGNYTLILGRTEDTYTVSVPVVLVAIPDLQATVVGTNCTANGADDGKVTVTNLAGSGDYSINFVTEGVVVPTDGSAPVVRVNLPPAIYAVAITDVVTGQVTNYQIQITEPDAVPVPVPEGTVLEVPALNSLTFVVDNTDVEQGLDNTLLCNQVYGDFQQEQYFQKLNKGDKPKVQFNSNYIFHYIELRKYADDSLITVFPVIKVEANIGKTSTYAVTLEDNGGGQTKVFFPTASLPLPLSVGDVFTISDNVDFDGTYAIVAIELDENTNAQYLTINKVFGAPGSTLANGIFTNTATAFDVFESEIDTSAIAIGQYYLKITAYTTPFNIKYATSEPIEIAIRHEGLILLVYNNFDNAFGVTWSTGYVGFKRIEGLFGHKRPTAGERTMSRDADYSPVKISARKTRNVLVAMYLLPPYLFEQLSVIFDTDVFSINNVACQSSEGLQPEDIDRSILVNASIIVEQLNWFSKYNSNDELMSSVSETADCACDEIDLVPVSSGLGTITLDFAGKRQRIFKIQPSFATNKLIALATTGLALSFRIKFQITQDFVDNAQYIQFPASFISNAGPPLWNTSTKRYSPIDAGLYEAEATFDGSNWQIIFDQSTFS